jgi:hypothetical protein
MTIFVMMITSTIANEAVGRLTPLRWLLVVHTITLHILAHLVHRLKEHRTPSSRIHLNRASTSISHTSRRTIWATLLHPPLGRLHQDLQDLRDPRRQDLRLKVATSPM